MQGNYSSPRKVNPYNNPDMNPALTKFLAPTKWKTVDITWFDADWSPRQYARLSNDNGDIAILLDSPPDTSPDSMIGHEIGAWSKINKHLRALGLYAPHIYAQDLENGYILMEDFGTRDLVGSTTNAYIAATDILITFRDHENAKSIDLLGYKDTHVYKALRFYPQYILGTPDLEKKWFAAWDEIESALPPCPQILTHIDFNASNLMWVNDRVGILDFQGACFAPFVYDMVNLLDDARRTIPGDIKQSCIDHYCASLSPSDVETFNAWYPVIKAQFHARVLGQILKLKTESGRDDLMQFFTPLQTSFEKQLHDPALAPILRLIEQER
ncbi:MAG: hypothetical protein COB76_00505 [Alphaproteobacteria bacterium]|nr:MAG: hypothetical protein COB76_00505 [Alphaproteobacteria bacterium]